MNLEHQLKRVALVPEELDDDDEETCFNSCTLEKEQDDEPEFDYYKFMEFHRFQYLLSQIQNMKKLWTEESSTSASILEGDHSSEDVVKRKFIELYGPVDFTTPLMQKRLQVARETIEESLSSSVEDPHIRSQLENEYVCELNPLKWEETWQTIIRQKFSQSEHRSFNTLNPRDADGDWFVLPRLELNIIRKMHLPNENENCDEGEGSSNDGADELDCATPPVGPKNLNRPLGFENVEKPGSEKDFQNKTCNNKNRKLITNLHLYDPKFEYCFQMPFRIFSSQEIDSIEIPKMTSLRILEHLNEFPYGVSPSVFWETYYNKHKRVPNVPMPSSNRSMLLDDLLYSHSKEIYIIEDFYDRGPLMFPSCLENVTNPVLILQRVWHAVKSRIGKESFLKLDTVFPDLLKQCFKFDFNPYYWSFSSSQEFLQFCLDTFSQQNNFILYRQMIWKNFASSHIDYITINLPSVKERISEQLGICAKKPRIPVKIKIANCYLNVFEKVDAMSNYLNKNDVFSVEVHKQFNPHRMFVVVKLQSYDLTQFQENIQDYPDMKDAIRANPPHPDQLQIGLYVVACLQWPEGEDTKNKKTWHRGKIMSVFQGKYLIYGIDFGFQKLVERKDIRFMPRTFVSEERAYAIPVRLEVTHPTNKERKCVWEPSATTVMRELLDRRDLNIQLLKARFNFKLGCKKWTIEASVIRTNEDGDVIYHSLSKTFIMKFQRELDRIKIQEEEVKAVKKAAKIEAKKAKKAAMKAFLQSPAMLSREAAEA